MRYTPWIVSEHVPDFSTLENLVNSPRFAGKSGQELAAALWQLMVDHDLGIFHYCPPWELLWERDVYDPLKIFNVYGFTICHVHANVLAMVARAAGFRARIAKITGHEGTEVFYDGRWHYFDADIQMFHRLRPPDEQVIASREDLYHDPTLVSDQPNPSFPYHMPDRLPKKFAKLYESKPEYPDVLEERIHPMDFRLRPGEEMTRFFRHHGRWVVFPHYPAMFKRYRAETGPEGPTERFWPWRKWGNGFFFYAPKLSPEYRDVEMGADEMRGLSLQDGGLVCAGDAGHVVFAFESPYVYCGIPDPLRRVPSSDGAVLKAVFDLPPGAAAKVQGAPELSRRWRTLWSSKGQSGQVECDLDFTELADAHYRLRLRLVLHGRGGALRSFQTRLWFMVSPHSLPALKNAGDNRMRLHCGDRYGLHTRPIMIEYRTDDPRSISAAHAAENLRHDPSDWVRLFPADAAKPWQVTYRLSAPRGGKMAWLRAYSIIQGRKPGEDYDGTPAKIEIAESPDGPWQTIAERQIVEDPHGWHFGVFGEGRLSGRSRNAYIRFSAKKGAHGFRVMGHYLPACGKQAGVPAGEPAPLEVEHAWYEVHPDVGRRLHRHSQTITGDQHEYVVHCEHEPHDVSITLRVPSAKTD
ncbi:MAG: hypothetical protein AMJ81_03250 [Phycisphaerae bacterium SM23_33]|nr:MAG: hypothetical protein AMJ81_03250 [Phycisphaerae bacterium SM23_33]